MLDKNMSQTSKIITYIILILFAGILLCPFLYMISIALATPDTNAKELFTMMPKEFYWKNFTELFSGAFDGEKPIGTWVLNTLLVVALGIAGQLFSSTFVAFGFARMRYKHKNKLFLIMLCTMMLPGQITLIPVFYLFTRVGLYNSVWPLIIPQWVGSAYNIFFTRQFISAIPGQLYEAAEIDGLSYMGIYRKIVIPLVKPALCAIAIFTFNATWGDVFGPLIYISDTNRMTLALGAANLSASSNPTGAINLSVCMCMSLLLSIPQIVVYFAGQKSLFHINLGIGNSGTK